MQTTTLHQRNHPFDSNEYNTMGDKQDLLASAAVVIGYVDSEESMGADLQIT